MAEMETHSKKRNAAGKRLLKKSTRVDLTPMVDLGFLLITFFVFTTTMAKPRAMGIVWPKDAGEPSPLCESCALTLIPAGNNSIYYYEGILSNSTLLKSTNYSAAGLRTLLLNKRGSVKAARGNEDEMSVVIRPADASTYKNFVDVLDEANITQVKRYYIDEITEAEKALLQKL